MLEKTILSNEIICDLLAKDYGISGIKAISRIPRGSANCYKINTTGSDYFLKEFQQKYSLDDIEPEARLNQFLKQKGIPTAEFVPNQDGCYAISYQNRALHLQEFIIGDHYANNSAPQWLDEQSALMLGSLHRIMQELPALRQLYPSDWYRSAYDKDLNNHHQLLVGYQNCNLVDKEQIIEDLHYKIEFFPKLQQVEIDLNQLSIVNSHADFCLMQLLCAENKIKAVIDFSSAARIPAVWELMRSYATLSIEAKNGQLDLERFKNHVAIYLSEHQLNKYDLKMMPSVWFRQLARSSYGYREYLQGTENGADLLEYAFWRTKMCRYLLDNLQTISDELNNKFS